VVSTRAHDSLRQRPIAARRISHPLAIPSLSPSFAKEVTARKALATTHRGSSSCSIALEAKVNHSPACRSGVERSDASSRIQNSIAVAKSICIASISTATNPRNVVGDLPVFSISASPVSCWTNESRCVPTSQSVAATEQSLRSDQERRNSASTRFEHPSPANFFASHTVVPIGTIASSFPHVTFRSKPKRSSCSTKERGKGTPFNAGETPAKCSLSYTWPASCRFTSNPS